MNNRNGNRLALQRQPEVREVDTPKLAKRRIVRR